MTDLLSLADRVEKAEAGSRELDALIWAEIDGRDVRSDGNMLLGKSRTPPHDECRIGYIDPGVINRNFSLAWSQTPIPAYTSSLDNAMSLVPGGKGWDLQGNTNLFYAVVAGQYSKPTTTPALALCAAALRARANGSTT